METKEINANEVKKELYKSKVNAKFSHYSIGKLYYNVELNDGTYLFPISTVESLDLSIGLKLSSDLGMTTFGSEIKASDLNRWIAKAIEKNEFIKIS